MAWTASINHWAMPGTSVREAAVLAKAAGFGALEVNIAETGEVSLETDSGSARAIRDAIVGEGLEVAGLSSGLYWTYPPTSDDPDMRRRASDICRKQLELAAELGAGAILVVPGVVGRYTGPPVVSYDTAYERAAEFLAELAPVAEAAGVDIGVENVWNKFLLSPLEMKRLVDEAGSERVRVYFDVGNILLLGYPEQWIRILGSRIARIHLKDFDRSANLPGAFVDIGAGDVDWEAVGEALRTTGYDGPLTAEVGPTDEERGDLQAYINRIGEHVRGAMARMGHQQPGAAS